MSLSDEFIFSKSDSTWLTAPELLILNKVKGSEILTGG